MPRMDIGTWIEKITGPVLASCERRTQCETEKCPSCLVKSEKFCRGEPGYVCSLESGPLRTESGVPHFGVKHPHSLLHSQRCCSSNPSSLSSDASNRHIWARPRFIQVRGQPTATIAEASPGSAGNSTLDVSLVQRRGTDTLDRVGRVRGTDYISFGGCLGRKAVIVGHVRRGTRAWLHSVAFFHLLEFFHF